MSLLKIVYIANIIIVSVVSITFLFFPKQAHTRLFEEKFAYSEAYRMLGALWLSLFLLSIAGLFYPLKMSLVLVIQLIYKGAWLLFAALPAKFKKQELPRVVVVIFVIYVAVLPFAIPWNFLFG